MPDKVLITKTKLDTLANTIASRAEVGAPITLTEMNEAASTLQRPKLVDMSWP